MRPADGPHFILTLEQKPMAEPQTNDLGGLIEGRSDEQISSEVEKQGVDKVLGDVFGAMAAAFDAQAAAGQSAIVQYDVTAADGVHSYQLKCADGKCAVQKGGGEPARITLSLSVPDFLRLIGGKLDGMQAFMSGKLRIAGDMMFAQTMQTWFKR
jgi:putative sterol carrier protein